MYNAIPYAQPRVHSDLKPSGDYPAELKQYLAKQAKHSHTTTAVLIDPSLAQVLQLCSLWLATDSQSTLQLVTVCGQAYPPSELSTINSRLPGKTLPLAIPSFFALPGCQRLRIHQCILWDCWYGDATAITSELHPWEHVALCICFSNQPANIPLATPQWHFGTPFTVPELCSKPEAPVSMAIIGAGIAGLSVADACHQRGIATRIYEQQSPLAGASGNPSAMLVPRPVKIPLYANTLHHLGARYSMDWLGLRHGQAINLTPVVWLLTGVQQADAAKTTGYPHGYYQHLEPQEIKRIGGYATKCAGLLLQHAATVNPALLANAISAHPLNQTQVATISTIKWAGNKVELYNPHGTVVQSHTHAVVCANIGTPALCAGLSELKLIRGQISLSTTMPAPYIPYAYGGYISKAGNTTLLGASYVRDDSQTEIRSQEHQHNLDLWNACLAKPIDLDVRDWAGRASIRSQVRDYYPLLGNAPTLANVYVLSALGSKGFAYAPICAEHLVGSLVGEMSPLSKTLAKACDSRRILNKW